MAFVPRRLLHTTPRLLNATSAQDASTELFARFGDSPISTRTQLLDANQLHLLNITLNRASTTASPPEQGTPIPPGHHLVYFTPSIVESELGQDGTDRTVNPLRPFTRRMWAGGELEWNQAPESMLRVGQTVRETTRLTSAQPKTSRNGGEMLVVGVEKTFENDNGVALTDRRSWVFQQELTSSAPVPPRPTPKPFKDFGIGNGKQYRYKNFRQTSVSLFRFSALTFNAHKIHFLPEWCREVEGHRGPVVHGPLNLINILDLWRDGQKETASTRHEVKVPKKITYRATGPIYAEEDYKITLNSEDPSTKKWKAELWDCFGKKGMESSIEG